MEEKIFLHFAFGDGLENIPELFFDDIDELYLFIGQIENDETIWLFTSEGEHSEIIITESVPILTRGVEFLLHTSNNLFLQSYNSYEDAYSVALNMREGHKRCYNEE